jgi:hypothetical protein
MPVDPVTRQQLLELIYDLLPEPQAAELRRRLDTEPELAEAYAEARRTAGLLADAARLEAPKVDLRRAQRAVSAPEAARGRPVRGRSSPWARGANWAVSIAATVLLAFSLGGYFYHHQELADLAANHIRLLVTGPSRLQPGMPNTYAIAATSVTGAPIATKIQLALYAPDGKPLLRQEEDTDAHGQARVRVRADLTLPAAARLEISAAYRNRREKLSAELVVAPVSYAADVQADRPWYRPGETARFRAVVLSRFSLNADRELPVQLAVVDREGATMPGFPRTTRTERGVAEWQWSVPGSLAAGQYTLLVRSPDGLFAPRSQTLAIRADEQGELDKQLEFVRPAYRAGDTVVASFSARRRDGQPVSGARVAVLATVSGATVYQASPTALGDGPTMIRFPLPAAIGSGPSRLTVTVTDAGRSETLVRPIPLISSKLDLRFQPESGPLVAGLRNRVYFSASDVEGRPVELRGVIVDSRDQEVAELETAQAGMGSFTFTPVAGEQYRARILAPAGATDEPVLPEVSVEPKVVLTTGPGVFAADRPLEFEIASLRGGLPLVVAAYCRGALVGQQALVTNDEEPRNKVALELLPEACGAIRLTVYDYRNSQPQPVAERLVYRHPGRQLQVTIRDGEKPYPPGQAVKLSLQTRNEKGEPVTAVLGVAAGADGQTPADPLPVDFYFDGQLAGVERLTDANLYQAQDPKAVTTLDLLLGIQSRRSVMRPASQLAGAVPAFEEADPPTVLDNLGQLRAEYEKNLAAYRAERTKALNTLTTLSFFGGFGLVLLVAMLAALKVVSGIRLWVPAFAAAIGCLLVGATLMNPDRFQPGLGAAVAYVPYRGPAELAMQLKAPSAAAGALVEQALTDSKARAPAPASEPTLAPAAPPPAMEKALRVESRQTRRGSELQQQEMEQSQQGGARLRAWSPPPPNAADESRHQPSPSRGFGLSAGAAPASADRSERVRRAKREAKPPAAAKPGASPAASIWNPDLETDAQGEAQLTLQLRAAGTYRVWIDAHGTGRLGHAERLVEAQIPCNLEPKLPEQLTLGDRLDLPLLVTNPTSQSAAVTVALKHGVPLKLEGEASRKLELKSDQAQREPFRLEAVGAGRCGLEFVGRAGADSRTVQRELDVLPAGYPLARVSSGRLRGSELISMDLPESQPGSLDVSLELLPTLLAQLEAAYEAVAPGPNGCAEQAAAAAWLSALALEWIQRNNSIEPEVVRRWRTRLETALASLARYEAPPRGFGGYEWFGGHPGEDSLSAFALAALNDVRRSAGVAVGEEHLAAWLRARLDPNAALRPDPKSTASAGATSELLGVAIAWALARHDSKSIETQVKPIVAAAAKASAPVHLALAASALLSAGAKTEALALLDRLAAEQSEAGHLEGKASVFGSRGRAAEVQATALAAIAWLQAGRPQPAERALAWLSAARQADGGFGPPLTTVLALRAFAEQDKTRPGLFRGGKLGLRHGDSLLVERTLDATEPGPVVLTGLASHFRPGKNQVSLSLASVDTLDYLLRVRMTTAKPNAVAGPVTLATRLENPRLRVGQTVALNVQLANPAEQAVRLAVAVVGLPAGLEPRAEQLQQLKKSGAIDQFSVGPRQLAFYWRSVPGRKAIALRTELVAAHTGRFQGPASMSYLYHSPDARSYAAPLTVEVAP